MIRKLCPGLPGHDAAVGDLTINQLTEFVQDFAHSLTADFTDGRGCYWKIYIYLYFLSAPIRVIRG